MDHGMTAKDALGEWKKPKKGPWQRPNYFMRMQQRFRLDVPAIGVRAVPRHIAGFIDDLFLDASVTKPVDDLYIGTHASSDGFLFVRLFRDQVDVKGKPADDITDFEILGQMKAPKIPDSLVGYQRTTPPTPPTLPTHSVHIKGCNIGRDRFLPDPSDPSKPFAPFLVKMKNMFGDNVNITAPKHFHGLIDEINHQGIFEYMAHEFIVRTKAEKATKGFKGTTREGFRGFANRDELIEAYKNAKLSFFDGTEVPDADWDAVLVPKPKALIDNRDIAMTVPLGQTIENLSSLPIKKEFRIDLEKVLWTLDPAIEIPKDPADRIDVLRASIAADPRFAATHPWPLWERRGFPDLDSYVDGHHWTFPKKPSKKRDNAIVGRRFDYTIVQPIVDRSVTPPTTPPLIFNFYPGPGSTDAAILTGLVESDKDFFGEA